MKVVKVLVCDDNKKRADDWLKSLGTVRGTVKLVGKALGANELRVAAKVLNEREVKARSKSTKKRKWLSISPFDGIDVAFIDYDLLKVDHLDGENLARLVRCYSDTAVIVVVNREYGAFDLKLRADPTVWADVDIHSTQIGNDGLWNDSWDGFRPWHWPLLPNAVRAFRANVKKFRKLLNQPIAKATGMSNEMLAVLPESVWEQVGKGPDRSKVQVSQVVDGVPMGLRQKEKLLDDDAVTRFAVARLTKWLCQVVLPGQSIIIDAPHLVGRLPCLLAPGKKSVPAVLNELRLISKTRFKALDDRWIRKYAFDGNGLVDRPVWIWPDLSKDTRIPDVREPWKVKPLPMVFCEDVSQFVTRSAARQFRAEVDSPYSARFVVNSKSRTVSARLKRAVKGISYEPASRFAL